LSWESLSSVKIEAVNVPVLGSFKYPKKYFAKDNEFAASKVAACDCLSVFRIKSKYFPFASKFSEGGAVFRLKSLALSQHHNNSGATMIANPFISLLLSVFELK
jgi:hypothetical protein